MSGRATAEERRTQIRQAAAAAFAGAGLHGTSVKLIASEIGISEAYVFRLFGTKRALFIDVVTAAFDAMSDGMVAAAGDATGVDALMLMGAEYKQLLVDRQRLMLQMQGFAACGDPDVRDAVRDAFGRLWSRVAAISGLDPLRVKTFIAFGMLLNDIAALDARGLPTDWAKQATTPVPRDLYDFLL
ncbi:MULTISPECIES: TetR/AcrR family transcriptional regulator [unclassified Micromonospora]|uniref:TetR/AcrR family transcriptional regulator n=1 Tax=unclassified Micromonospora TaxID=2617518 RepID=UPI0033A00B58